MLHLSSRAIRRGTWAMRRGNWESRVMRLDCLAFSPSLCLSLDVSVHGTTFFSAATQTPSALVVTEEERKENRYLAGQRPTHRGRSMRNSNNGTLTSPFSLERTVAIRCHTFFRKPRQTDMCANLGRRRAEVRELGAGSSTANQCEQELKLWNCAWVRATFFFFHVVMRYLLEWRVSRYRYGSCNSLFFFNEKQHHCEEPFSSEEMWSLFFFCFFFNFSAIGRRMTCKLGLSRTVFTKYIPVSVCVCGLFFLSPLSCFVLRLCLR